MRLLQKANGGQASAFNAGIPECIGEIVAFLDGDDWWVPKKLSHVIPVFARDPKIGMVGHGTIMTFPGGSEFTEVLQKGHRFSLQTVEGGRMFRSRKSFLGTRSAIRTNILKKVLPVPETIRIEADEFVFTMAAALGEVEILPEALFFYRLHSGNLYSQHGFNVNNVRRKQQSIAELARNLELRLRDLGTSEAVVQTIVHAIQVEADQLRLSTDGGMPWETVRTELAMYHLLHSDAPWSHRAFKYATLLPAYFLSATILLSSTTKSSRKQLVCERKKSCISRPAAGTCQAILESRLMSGGCDARMKDSARRKVNRAGLDEVTT